MKVILEWTGIRPLDCVKEEVNVIDANHCLSASRG